MYLIYFFNGTADIIVKTPFGDAEPFTISNPVKQGGIVLGPMLSNCSVDGISDNGQNYQYGEVKIFPLEFVDDIAEYQ